MELTREQQDIIQSAGHIKINAVAGSGKTTTIIEYAKARPRKCRILYLAFNKSVKLEAIKKFEQQGLDNVKVETTHSLAFKHTVGRYGYRINPHGYNTQAIAEILGLQGNGEKHAEFILANHVNKFCAYFCNSDKARIQDLNYLETVSDPKAKTFVSTFYTYIEKQTRQLLARMDKGEIEITHDFYLKKFQLMEPQLPYDYILFDEGQDASAAMLDLFLKQKATKVIVGDTHQQIYGWRYAINSLENTDFKTYYLSTSFRFGQDIARLAVEILQWKRVLNMDAPATIHGKGNAEKIKTKAVIARTNLGLLLKAIEYVTEKKKVKKIYFEGNINSYTYADDGASLYDVLHLYNMRHSAIKDKLIRQMKNLEELEEYIKLTDDVQLGMMVEIVREYGNDIPGIIRSIKAKHIETDNKEEAEMIFSTVHRSKGMEYDAIQIVNDFITLEKLEKYAIEAKRITSVGAKLNEEINLLYVALTRAKKSIHLPETLLPQGLPASKHIHIMRVPKEEKPRLEYEPKPLTTVDSAKAYSVAEARNKHHGAYMPWTEALDEELTVMYCEGINAKDMAKHFGRTRGAIRSRIKKLELEDIYG